MINIHSIDANPGLREVFRATIDINVLYAHHSRPLSILYVLFGGSPNTLGLMQTKEAVVKLPYDVLRVQEIIE